MAASDKRGPACWLSSLIPQAHPRHLRIWFAVGLLLLGGVGTACAQNEAEAEALLKSVREKFQGAKTLQVDIKLKGILQKTVDYSGSVFAKEKSLWGMDLTRTMEDESAIQRAFCDGKWLKTEGFKDKSKPAFQPDHYNRQLREWCATSFVVMFIGLLYEDIDQGDNNIPTAFDVKISSREKFGEIDTVVIDYSLRYPTQTLVTVKAWIDPKTQLPVQRVTTSGHMTLIESIGSVAIDKEIPDSKFILKPVVPNAPSPAPEDQQPAR
jgi:outer membrane lipoprotein-sorting protein